MIEVIMGIDPGLKGCVSVILDDSIEIFDIPIVAKPYGKGNMISPQLLTDIFDKLIEKYYIKSVFVEAVSAMPGQGVSSVFSFGRSVGVIEGVVSAFKLPINYVTPQKWKKFFELTGKEKDAARGKVLSLYPNQIDLFKLKKNVDRADATLIGLYGKSLLT